MTAIALEEFAIDQDPGADAMPDGVVALSVQSNHGDARVLDVFAGSGALGLEALSRGAERAGALGELLVED